MNASAKTTELGMEEEPYQILSLLTCKLHWIGLTADNKCHDSSERVQAATLPQGYLETA
jgi:hypothetical protein